MTSDYRLAAFMGGLVAARRTYDLRGFRVGRCAHFYAIRMQLLTDRIHFIHRRHKVAGDSGFGMSTKLPLAALSFFAA
jgi:hypothetical protein